MKVTLLYVMLVIVALGSCTKEARLRKKEDRLIGVWEFEKVTYKKDFALFRKNITHEYRHDIVEFFPDYSAVYDDYSLRAVFYGDWNIFIDEDYYGEDNDLEFFVDAVFYDFLNHEDFYLYGSIDRLNRNKLNFEASDSRGTYTFKLRRL